MLRSIIHTHLSIKASLVLLTSVLFLSACNTTSVPEVEAVKVPLQRMDVNCITQVNSQQATLQVAHSSQYLSLANAAIFCIEGLSFTPRHPDVQTAMQFNALAFTNYVKAGDMQQAQDTLADFRNRFPQQDLLFADYTSFVDTAKVLVSHNELSLYQLSTLNINSQLRAEIKRKRNWHLN